MSSQPLVSLITPSYNQGTFIAETIESVLAQDYPHLEYRIIDGGSTDDTLDIIQSYASDPRLSWISEADEGMSHALNKGFRRAKGSIMGWLNSDDVLIGQPISATVAHFTAHPEISLIYGQVIFTHADGSPTGLMMGAPFNLVDVLSDSISIPQPGTFWRRSLWEQVGEIREDLHYAMDVDYWVRASRQGRFYFMPEIRATYRQHLQSKTGSQDAKAWLERQQITQDLLRQPQLYPELQNQRRLLESNLALGLAQVHLRAANHPLARRYAWQALKKSPARRRWFYLLAFFVDTLLGTKLAEEMSRLWRKLK
jgi:glycosyltransferase involved in cell wall biosynthesis